MSRFLGRSIDDLNRAHGARFVPDALRCIVHEAAHATVAAACGLTVTSLSVFRAGRMYHGVCDWRGTTSADNRALVAAAGAAGHDFRHWSYEGLMPPWWDSREDAENIRNEFSHFIGEHELERYRERAIQILEKNKDTFDQLCDALLRNGGRMTEEDIRAVVDPGYSPSAGEAVAARESALPPASIPPSQWTRAHRLAVADKIEEMIRTRNIPPQIQRTIRELERQQSNGTSSLSGIPAGIRHGESIPLDPPRSSHGYEHRALHTQLMSRRTG